MLEQHPDHAVGEQPLGTDLLLPGAGGVDPEARERDGLHQRRLAGAVLAEDPDDLRRQFQVDLLEHAVVAERQLEDPHTVSPLASWSSLVPIPTTRSRSRPARSWSSRYAPHSCSSEPIVGPPCTASAAPPKSASTWTHSAWGT